MENTKNKKKKLTEKDLGVENLFDFRLGNRARSSRGIGLAGFVSVSFNTEEEPFKLSEGNMILEKESGRYPIDSDRFRKDS